MDTSQGYVMSVDNSSRPRKMSRWDKLKQRPDLMAKVCEIYGPHFPIEVRYFLCQWIEGQAWSAVNTDNPGHEHMARQLLKDMLEQLRLKCAELSAPDFLLIRMQFETTQRLFHNDYDKAPMGFVRTIKSCLLKEECLFNEIQGEDAETEEEAEQEMQEEEDLYAAVNREVMGLLKDVSDRTAQQQRKMVEMQNRQENFILQYQENVNINNMLQALETLPVGSDRTSKENMLKLRKEENERHLSQQAKNLLALRIQIADMVRDTVNSLQNVQRRVLDDELINWKRRQQLAGNGLSMDPRNLDMLQSWCEELADTIWLIRQQIKKVNSLRAQLPIDFPPGHPDLMPELNDVITGLLSSLVTSTFIVEAQPPQVLKKDSRFSATVRLLVGSKLNVHMSPPTIRASIISEHQAKMLLRSDMKAKDEKSGEILNNTGTFEYKPSSSSNAPSNCSGILATQFRNMQLKRIRRSDKKGSEAVTEEKFCILFQSDFTVGGNDLVFQVWTLSLPVVVTVHGNQECNAVATVLWDNAFSEPGRIPFLVPDSVPWSSLGEQLNMKFQATVGRGLTEDNLNYLASKIFGNKPDYSQSYISWSQFNKDSLKDRSFTFWEWFYNVLKLTKEHLKGPWCDGSIIGFVSKTGAQDMLNQAPNGTFLLRFSDSECGGITIAWIAEVNARTGEREVWNLHPFSGKDFSIRPMSDRMKDLGNLVTLYPNIPKDKAFGKYYSVVTEDDKQPTTNGYIRPHLVTVVSMPKGNNDAGESNLQGHSNMPSPVSPADSTSFSVQELSIADEIMTGVDGYSTDYDALDIATIDVNQLLQTIQH